MKPTLSRRSLLVAAAATAGIAFLPTGSRAAGARPRLVDAEIDALLRPDINPRVDWARELPVLGPLESEAPGDVRFLVVHHSETANTYERGAVDGQLRAFYRYHTGPEKRWPDLAYNFLIDRFGGIWEGRQGSLQAPIKGSASGGSQGFALLCCFIGDHTVAPPTAEAQAAMTALLAWLGARYSVDVSPGASARFISRGSSRFPAGTPVETRTVSGHRDVSRTLCPGDACYPLIQTVLAAGAARRVEAATASTAEPETPATPSRPMSPEAAPRASRKPADPVPPAPAPSRDVAAAPDSTNDQTGTAALAIATTGAIAVGAAAVAVVRAKVNE